MGGTLQRRGRLWERERRRLPARSPSAGACACRPARARPTLANLGPFLQELNPILEWLEQNQREVSQFISNGIMAITDETESLDPLGRGHYLAQIGPIGAESIGVYRDRLPTNRGNAYVAPAQLDSRVKNIKSIIPSFDCNNAGGDQDPDTSLLTTAPGCLTQTPPDFQGQRTKYPQVRPNDYSNSR